MNLKPGLIRGVVFGENDLEEDYCVSELDVHQDCVKLTGTLDLH